MAPARMPITSREMGIRSLEALRGAHRRGAIDPLTAAVMESVDPQWHLSRNDRRWAGHIARLDEHAEIFGHCRVTRSYTGGMGHPPLGRWLARQQKLFALGELDDARRIELEARPGWAWEPRDQSFMNAA
jgi:hypothetical protein